MDTNWILEWNCWYHLMNCGFPLKVSGETDFPCISGGRVGQGRVYVQLGKIENIDFRTWCHLSAQGVIVRKGHMRPSRWNSPSKARRREPNPAEDSIERWRLFTPQVVSSKGRCRWELSTGAGQRRLT